ncbi:membrane-associated proteins in eicosanoid and glutathione metabolism [Punctularia strigosozonata HHB-11173 SS5]|uniref:membrane-associated proteins in eicosanoid and glutathione metabolism n=1 Tax=Punctularia strigosozonata (strain HHB-11173) TaxID=741275 RepID=UPI0004416DF4|nr:membrane-associated proteins in eicosanoid and glutathione metabolism [Punctularia strigosozonata HHB-11173 SS5]EIN14017.1 membrane-associated proteins in eicosanoid and glutathione metabolism [Punctularia strigosozonata HHB-11173 SS5]
MSNAIVLPEKFSYVAAAGLSTVYLCVWQTFRVGRARKASGIQYPQVYAEKAEAQASKAAQVFNCTQRAHQNTLEALPLALTMTLITGLKYPEVASGLCATWVFGRIFYTINYSKGDASKRGSGLAALGSVSLLGLLVASTWTVGQFIKSSL